MEWYYVWWPWLISKRVARVCRHQLSFLYWNVLLPIVLSVDTCSDFADVSGGILRLSAGDIACLGQSLNCAVPMASSLEWLNPQIPPTTHYASRWFLSEIETHARTQTIFIARQPAMNPQRDTVLPILSVAASCPNEWIYRHIFFHHVRIENIVYRFCDSASVGVMSSGSLRFAPCTCTDSRDY